MTTNMLTTSNHTLVDTDRPYWSQLRSDDSPWGDLIDAPPLRYVLTYQQGARRTVETTDQPTAMRLAAALCSSLGVAVTVWRVDQTPTTARYHSPITTIRR